MSFADRWQLPDGVEEILPAAAEQIEHLRRKLLDLYHRWGYDLVIPPLIEYTDSLLVGLGADIDLQTFRITDQLSGRMMGIRADITPQIARMDAHSFQREGISRLCYTGDVLHTKPHNPLASRTPIQIGAELFGNSGLNGDLEVISLLIETLKIAEPGEVHIDLGHVALFRALVKEIGLNEKQVTILFDLMQRKAMTDINQWVAQNVQQEQHAQWLRTLPTLSGDPSLLNQARKALTGAPATIFSAIDELEFLATQLQQRYPDTPLYFDLSELRGYHYHTGVVFAAFSPFYGESLAKGGRYDAIGGSFGKGRPATGFAVELSQLNRIVGAQFESKTAIYAPPSHDAAQWEAIQSLRAEGERVIAGVNEDAIIQEETPCDRQLIQENDQYVIRPYP